MNKFSKSFKKIILISLVIVVSQINIGANSTSNKLIRYYTITEEKIDVDNNGSSEKIKVILKEGCQINNNLYKGKYIIQIVDNKNKKISEVNLTRDDLELKKGFKIQLEDYNNDGNIDFNIGNRVNYTDKVYLYDFFTVNKKGIIDKIPFDYLFYSCQKSYSYKFKKVYDNSFFSYRYNEDKKKYIYTQYSWYDGKFCNACNIDSTMDLNELDLSLVKQNIEDITKLAPSITKREIMEKCSEKYKWLVNHKDERRIFDVIEGMFNLPDKYKKLISLMLEDDYNYICLNYIFNDSFNIKDIKETTMKQVKQLKSSYLKKPFVYKEYKWKVDNKNYYLLIGKALHEDIVMLFNEKGQFLDALYCNQRDGKAKIEYLPIQNMFLVEPVDQSGGTGVSINPIKIYTVCKERLVSNFEFMEDYYDCVFYEGDKCELLRRTYDNKTGGLILTYKISMAGLEIEKEIIINWNKGKKSFEPNYDKYEEFMNNELFNNKIGNEIFNNNYEKIISMIEDIKEKEEYNDMVGFVTFIVKTDKNEKRDVLLQNILEWFNNIDVDKDEWVCKRKDEVSKMIEDAIKPGN